MADNTVYDTANELERAIRNNEEFKALEQALNEIQEDPTSRDLFNRFREATQNLQVKQMNGEEPEAEEIEAIQALSEEVQANAKIQSLMEREQRVSQIINDINTIITRPLNEIYNTPAQD